jgi:CBS domain-containing protein
MATVSGVVAANRWSTEEDAMPTARELMTERPTIVSGDTSVADIAKRLREDRIGAVIVCGTGERLAGLVTDRDIAVEVVAAGKDAASTTASDILAGRETVTIGADDDLDATVRTMTDHAVRRLPVIDGDRVVGLVSQADVARHADDAKIAELVRAVSDAPDNTGQG